jgi:site-specific DNA-adenine methylase
MTKTLRSPLYLQGNKYKLYQTIKHYLQDGNRTTFHDVFSGSLTVTLNVFNDGLFHEVNSNEKASWLFGLQEYIRDYNCVDIITSLHKEYGKSKEEYLRLRGYYNDYPTMAKLYLLMCRGFSNQVRFDSKGKHDMPWGDRSPFFPERLTTAHNLLRDVNLYNEDFGDYIELILKREQGLSGHTFYFDPPYFASLACYQDHKGGWTKEDDLSLQDYAVELVSRGAKVVMSNVFHNKGKTNHHLMEWCDEYKELFDVHHLNIDYNNSSCFKSDDITDEVLIVSRQGE